MQLGIPLKTGESTWSCDGEGAVRYLHHHCKNFTDFTLRYTYIHYWNYFSGSPANPDLNIDR